MAISLQPLAHRLEGDRDDGGGDDRQRQVGLAAAADQGPDADHDADVDGCDERRQRAVDEGSTDDDVDVVEVIPEDGDPYGRREPDYPNPLQDDAGGRRRALQVDEVERSRNSDVVCRAVGEPLELVADVRGRTSISEYQRHHRGQRAEAKDG